MNNKKIVNKLLFWFLLIALLPLTSVTAIQYYIARKSQVKEVNSHLVAIAESKAKQLEKYLNERQKNAATIAQIPNIVDAIEQYQKAFVSSGINSLAYRQADQKYRPFLTNYLDIFGYSDIFLISQSGDAIFSVKRGQEFGSNYKQQIHKNSELAKVFDRAQTLMQIEISNFSYYKPTNQPAAFIAAPVFKNNLIIGVVVLQLHNQEFNKVVNDYIGLGKTGETIVGSVVGKRVVFTTSTRHDPKAAFQRAINISQEKSHPLNLASHGIKGTGITIDYRGQETIAAWRYLPSLNAGLLVKIDTAEVFASLDTQRNIVIFLGTITLLLVIFAAIVVAKSISKPVVELTQAVQEFAQGNLHQQASVLTQDEIGQLSQSFNRMAEQLKASFDTIKERETELAIAKEQLQKEVEQLAVQLVQSEKMSSLGQLVAGVAHEINNPVNFIDANLTHANNYTQDLLTLIELYQKHYPQPDPEIQNEAEAIDLNFLIADFPKLLNSMKVGAKRIKEIVLSLRNFSRLDEAECKPVDIHEGIDNTLMILENRLKDKLKNPAIEVVKEYGELPLVECYAGQLNQVFMNILANAIDALEESINANKLPSQKPQIHLRTEITTDKQVNIRIADNGLGIPEDLQKRLFDPFFTTKPAGKGTGLGLSISYKIITEKHQGKLQCISTLGEGTEFVITIPQKQKNK